MRLPTFIRLIHINFVLIKHGLDKIVLSIPIFSAIRFIAFFNPWNWAGKDSRSRGERIRHALEELGPIFVKFGQALSTRRDLLPVDIADELEKLQDQVPPFPGELAQKIIEDSLGKPIGLLFNRFNIAPLASASIAQVHEATLFDNKEVVVKVLRPGIEKLIQRDVRLLYTLAKLAERYWSEGPRLHPVAIIKQFESHIVDELDLTIEAANAVQLRRNFLNSAILYVPEIYWPYVTSQVIVMERIWGIPISDINALNAAGIDLKLLAERGMEIFFTQVFRDSFFHADMHPGNIFVAAKNQDPCYIAVDFGIMGTLTSKDKRYLAENILAFLKRDYEKVAELHLASGWIPPSTPLNEFAAAIRIVCEPIFEQPLKDISLSQMLMRLFQTGRRFNMEVQPQLTLLQKTLLNIEGLGKQLYPDLDLWSSAEPFLEHWIKEELGPKAFIKNLCNNAPYWLEKLPEMPGLLYEVLEHIKKQPLAHPQVTLRMHLRTKRQEFLKGFSLALFINSALIAYFIPVHTYLFSLGLAVLGLVIYAVTFHLRD